MSSWCWIVGLWFCLALTGCHSSTSQDSTSAVFQVKEDRVVIASNSKFLQHIEVLSLGNYESREVSFQSIGKMIALSNASNELTGPATTWTELDPGTTGAVHLRLQPEPEGTSYGVTSVPTELVPQIRLHQEVRLKHYRVTEEGWKAEISGIVPTNDSSTFNIVFRVPKGHDLYPGTTCEVAFPLLRAKAIKVPATALLHHGLDEYIWQEIAPNEFAPHKVILVEGSSDEVILSSGITANSKIIGHGAILLKPEIKTILAHNNNEDAHAREVDRHSP
jgi:hypothetical protein